jgi:hypothetical protein
MLERKKALEDLTCLWLGLDPIALRLYAPSVSAQIILEVQYTLCCTNVLQQSHSLFPQGYIVLKYLHNSLLLFAQFVHFRWEGEWSCYFRSYFEVKSRAISGILPHKNSVADFKSFTCLWAKRVIMLF